MKISKVLLFLVSATICHAAPSEKPQAPMCAAFQTWKEAQKNGALTVTEVSGGLALAKERRQELKTLMTRNPRAALNWAVSRTDKNKLPAEVAGQLEDEIAGEGYAGPLMAARSTDTQAVPSISLTVNGQVLRVYLHGNQFARTRWWKTPVRGIAIDGVAVLEDDAQTAVQAPPRVVKTRTTHRTYDTGSLKITNKDGFDVIERPGLESLEDEPGTPWLPCEVINVAIPSGAEVRGFRVVRFNELKIREGVVPPPVQPPRPLIPDAATQKVPPKAEAYNSAERMPKDVALLVGDHNRVGHRYVSLRLNPLRYEGTTKTLYAVSEVTIEIDYEPPRVAPSAPASKTVAEARARVKQWVVNPDDVESPLVPSACDTGLPAAPVSSGTEASGVGQPLSDIGLETTSGKVDYLIITSAALAPAFTNLATHRQSHNGFTAHVKTLSDIVAQYSGVDTQAMIRACIIDYFTASNISYVVLGGDDTGVPDRNCYVTAGGYIVPDMPTDLYYSGLDSTWDENGNGIYGEGVGCAGIVVAEGDLAYDVMVGRIPVRTTAQATAYINKIINYDTQPPGWIAHKFMLSGKEGWNTYSDDDRPADLVNDGHLQFRDPLHPAVSDSEITIRRAYRDHVQTSGWNAVTVGCMFDTLTSWDASMGGDYDASGANCQAKYSLGWNFLYNFTHGNSTFLSAENGNFTASNAAGMTNLTALFYTCACLSGGFDIAEPSLSEAMLRNANGGALIYLGCSRYGWSGTSPNYANQFWDKIFKVRTQVIGPAFAEHKLAMAPYASGNGSARWVQFGLNLQGDPAMDILGVKPYLSVSATAPLASESGADTGQLTIHREPATSNLTVYLTFSGTATRSGTGSDISDILPTAVTFTNGESDKVIFITPVNDSLVEADETVTLAFATDSAYEFNANNTATVTLVDDDNATLPVVAIVAADASAVEEDGAPGCFTFMRTGNSKNAVTINYALSGTASADDYAPALSGSITIPAGQTTTNLTLTPVDDSLSEETETLTLTLLASASYTLASSKTATVSIANNDTGDGTWTNKAGGSWLTGSNWSGKILANGTDKTADFSTLNITANTTVTLDGVRTIGNLKFGDTTPSHRWTLNAGTEGYLDLDVSSGSCTLTVNNQTATLGLVLDGADPVIKAGAGTLIFTGANSYDGGTVVNGGLLVLNAGVFEYGIVNGTATVNSGAVLRLDGTGSRFPVKSSDTLNVNGGGTLNMTNAITQDSCCYLGTLNLSSANGTAASVTTADGSMLKFGYFSDGLITSTGSVANTYGAKILTANSGSGTLTVTAAAGNTLSLLGAIIDYTDLGGTPLLFNGAGTVVLRGTNTYSGATTVAHGTLLVDGSLSNSVVTVYGGATLGGTGVVGKAVVNNNGILAAGDPRVNSGLGKLTVTNLTLTAGAILQVQYGASSTDLVSVAKAVTLPDQAVVQLLQVGGATRPSKITLIKAGSVSGPPSGNFSGWTLYGAAGTFAKVGNDIVLTITGNGANAYYWDVNGATAGAGGVTPNGVWNNVATNWNTDPSGASGLFTNALTSGDSLFFAAGSEATGSYTVDLAAGARSVRNVTVEEGNVVLTNGTLTVTTVAINAGGLTLAGALQLNAGVYAGPIDNNGMLSYASSSNQTFSGIMSGEGSLTKANSSTLTLTATNTFTGATTISAGTLTLGGGGQLGSGTYMGAITNSGAFVYASSANQTLSGIIRGTGSLTKTNTSTLTLSGANTFTGAITNNAGTLKIGNMFAFGALNNSVNKVIVSSGGAVDFNGVLNATYGYTIAGTGVGGSGVLLNTGAAIPNNAAQCSTIKLSDNATIGGSANWALLASLWAATTLDLNGKTLTKSGANTIYLCNATILTGAIQVSAGTLATVKNAVNGSAATFVLDNTAGVVLALGDGGIAGNANLSVGSLSGGGATGGTVNLYDKTLTVGALNTGTTYGGVIYGTGALVKNGTAALTLTATNTYTGATTISSGTLVVDGSVSNSALTVYSGATLCGTGVVGAVTVAAGGILAAGAHGLGTLNLAKTLALNTGSILYLRLNKTSGVCTADKVNMTGASGIAFAGTLTGVTRPDSEAFAEGDMFDLFDLSAGAFTGHFSTANLPVLADGLDWDLSQLAVDGSIQVSRRVSNVGYGGVVTYTDANGLNPSNAPYANGYVVHTFTTVGTTNFTVSVAAGSVDVEYLLVGGGGSGGSGYGGGGGAGGLLTNKGGKPKSVLAGSYTVVVGSGGAGVSAVGLGTPGAASSAFRLTASGGGSGGGNGSDGGPGGSGGGASKVASSTNTFTGGIGVPGQGNDGGHAAVSLTYNGGGGGGGAGAPGGSVTGSAAGGAGGIGVQSSLGGTTNGYAAGGSGVLNSTSASGIGGNCVNGQNGGAGAANTGSGGGANGKTGGSSGNGGSGIVILRYRYVAEMPLTAFIMAPSDGKGSYPGTALSATATVANASAPCTVTFYTNVNGGAFVQAGEPDNSEPYTLGLGTPPAGTYGIYAVATNASERVATLTNLFTVATDNVATGGTVTYTDADGLKPRSSPPYTGGYVVHTFTTVGTNTLTVPGAADGLGVEYLLVGGGGSGGNSYGGGGGAGGLRTNVGGTPLTVSAGACEIVVGGGGAGVNVDGIGKPGTLSSAFGLKANGGGWGGGNSIGGGAGGSGGGSSGSNGQPGPGNTGYGNRGGPAVVSSASGGGGAGGVGGSAASYGGYGGAGLLSSISGASAWYAAGGSGVFNTTSASGIGGNCVNGLDGGAGVANTGSGGGANGRSGGISGTGGSGIVIVRYPYVTSSSGMWTNLAGGSWPATGNWLQGIVGQGAGVLAFFNTLTLPANTAVTLDGARTVGGLTFKDKGDTYNWTVGTGTGGPLTLEAAGTPEINVSNRTTTISAVIAGTNGLLKTGGGTLVLHEVNTFSGGVTVSGGTLDWQNTPNSSAGTITVNAGCTAKFHGTYLNYGYAVANALVGAGTVTAKPGFGNGVAGHSSGYVKFSGDLSSFTGTFIFDTTVNYGELSVAANADGSRAKWVVNRTGGPYYLSVGQAGTYKLGELSGNGALGAYYLGGTATWEVGALGTDSTFDGVINNSVGSGVAALRKVGAGKLTLTKANGYSGGTVVSNGVLEVGVNASLGTSTVEVTGGRLRLLGSSAISDAAQLRLPNATNKLELATGVNETVGELTIGGELAWRGTWGRIGSSCWHKSAAITGDGILTVTGGPKKIDETLILFF